MSQLLTQCPFCQTTFRVSEPQLQAASGVVRCGRCMEVFLATQLRVILKERPSRPQSPKHDISADFPAAPAHTETPENTATENTTMPDWQVVDDGAPPGQDDAADVDNKHAPDVSWDEAFDEEDPEDSADAWPDTMSASRDDWLEEEDTLPEEEDDGFEEEDFEDDTDADADADPEDTKAGTALDHDMPNPDSTAELQETDDHHLFSSWEAEEAFRARHQPDLAAANDPALPGTDEDAYADDFGFEDDDDADEDQDDADAGTADADDNSGDDLDAPEASEKPDYSGRLSPAGHAMASFSVTHVLPKKSAIDETLENDASWWDAPNEHDGMPAPYSAEAADSADDWQDDDAIAETSLAGTEPVDAPDSASADQQSAPVKTPVIVPEKRDEIPTLVPDLVASEEIPAQSLGAQTMAWFQSIRRSFKDNRDDDRSAASYAGNDEKAVIRRQLVNLRDEDSLELVDPDALEHLDEIPVELPLARPRLSNLQQTGFVAAAAMLLLALAFQYTWFHLDRLIQERRLPAITGLLCRMTACPDPQVIDLTALVTEELIVRSHPTVAAALQVDFIFRNDSNREQRFPLVELNFSNNDGDVIANRVFTSEEYMPGEMQLFTHMPAHSSIQVSLELVDPGLAATGYSLVFRNP